VVLKAGYSKIKVLADSVSREDLVLIEDTSMLCPHMVAQVTKLPRSSFIQELMPLCTYNIIFIDALLSLFFLCLLNLSTYKRSIMKSVIIFEFFLVFLALLQVF
jgi:hypothetical protein